MRLYVITTGTKDYGDAFVVREHEDGEAYVQPVAVCESLEAARGAVEERRASLVRLPRSEFDDQVIVESWGEPADVERCLMLQHALETGAVV